MTLSIRSLPTENDKQRSAFWAKRPVFCLCVPAGVDAKLRINTRLVQVKPS